MKKATIKDIAEKVSVSTTTVSLVLNSKPTRVAQATKDRIFEVARELNYKPNIHAKSLVTNKTNTIGLVIPDIENAFFSSFSKAVEDISYDHDYMVLLVNSNDYHERSTKVIKMLLNRGVDGLLIVSANESYKEEFLNDYKALLKDIGIPFVLIDRVFDDINANSVSFNGELGGYLATKHLIEKGNSIIACITGPKGSRTTTSRLAGYKRALNEYKIAFNKNIIFEGDYHFDSGYREMNNAYETDATAIFAFNDLMAFGALNNIHRMNMDNNYDIIGYDNIKDSSMINYNIDSIEQNSKKIGAEACRILYEQIKTNKSNNVVQVVLEPELIVNKKEHIL